MGQWIGYGKYVYSTKEKQEYKERKEQEWHFKFITVWRLKKQRLWTDKLIKDFLGAPITQGKYKVFNKKKVKDAENKKDFIKIMDKRIENKKQKDEFFTRPEKL